jgi:prepilin-type N-terminal cleavage/methylation domain-containing protein
MLNKKGFSLVEIMIVISILSLIIFITGDMITNGFKTAKFQSEQETAVATARKSMGIITKDIRGANTSERGDYPLKITQEDELVFFDDIDDDNIMEKVRYYLSDSKLIREIYLPGALKDYAVLSASSTAATYVNNNGEPIFSYFDADSAETDVINQVRMIRIYIMINVTPAIAPNDYILESDVNLRNLKDY